MAELIEMLDRVNYAKCSPSRGLTSLLYRDGGDITAGRSGLAMARLSSELAIMMSKWTVQEQGERHTPFALFFIAQGEHHRADILF